MQGHRRKARFGQGSRSKDKFAQEPSKGFPWKDKTEQGRLELAVVNNSHGLLGYRWSLVPGHLALE